MLGSAGFKSDAVRDIITGQTARGLWRMSGINCRGKPEEEKAEDFLDETQHINTDGGISESGLRGIARRLENRYKDPADREHEYTVCTNVHLMENT